MLFEFVRLSLFERTQLDLEERRKADGSRYTREEWLRLIFSQEIPFLRRGAPFVYVPEPEIADPAILVGRIGRKTKVRENEPPEASLHETERESWQAALVFIDPRDHPDGQKMAIEIKGVVGKPSPLAEAMAQTVNANTPPGPYFIETHPITDPETFWDYVRENKGSVTSITLEVAAPNMFRSADDFSEEMKQLRDSEKTRTIKVELQNPDGLEPETKRIEQAVEYTSRGGGTIKAKAKGKKPYNSRNRTKKKKVAEDSAELPMSARIMQALKSLFQ